MYCVFVVKLKLYCCTWNKVKSRKMQWHSSDERSTVSPMLSKSKMASSLASYDILKRSTIQATIFCSHLFLVAVYVAVQERKRLFSPYLHMATSEMWYWSGGRGILIKKTLCVTVLCTIIMVHKDMSSSYRSVDCIRLWSCLVYLCLPSASVSLVFMVLYIDIEFFLLRSFSLPFSELSLVGLALTWLTNHYPSVLWHCWLGHVTHKIVSEMTYNVSSGTVGR